MKNALTTFAIITKTFVIMIGIVQASMFAKGKSVSLDVYVEMTRSVQMVSFALKVVVEERRLVPLPSTLT